jgi:hypothetical protein
MLPSLCEVGLGEDHDAERRVRQPIVEIAAQAVTNAELVLVEPTI